VRTRTGIDGFSPLRQKLVEHRSVMYQKKAKAKPINVSNNPLKKAGVFVRARLKRGVVNDGSYALCTEAVTALSEDA
jgi:hypothetical protein